MDAVGDFCRYNWIVPTNRFTGVSAPAESLEPVDVAPRTFFTT